MTTSGIRHSRPSRPFTDIPPTGGVQTGPHLHQPNNHPVNETADPYRPLIHTAAIAGYAIEADVLCARLPGKPTDPDIHGVYRLGSPGTCEPLHELTPWLQGPNSPFSDRFSIADGVARLIPLSLDDRAAMSECFQPFTDFGGVADAVSLRFYLDDANPCTLLYLRRDDHSQFSGNNLWMLKHLMPAIAKDIRGAHSRWLKQQTWNNNARLGPINRTTLSTEDLLKRLSKTERRILERLKLWETEREVALAVGRSPHTVHVHVKSIYRKLMVTNRRQLLALVSTDQNKQAPLPATTESSNTSSG